MDPIPAKPYAKLFELPDLYGDSHSLTDFRGKFVLVNFWSTACPVCYPELSSLNHNYQQLKDKGFAIIAIHAGAEHEQTNELLKVIDVKFTVVFDVNLEMGDWSIPRLPATYLVDPAGRLIYRVVGTREWDARAMIQFFQGLIDAYAQADSGSE